MLTIGQLAKQAGLRPSALRYYQSEGLLEPDDHTDSGYRLYRPERIEDLRLIQRAQRLGLSLAEIRPLLAAWQTGDLSDEHVLDIAESRYLALVRRVTDLQMQQHELEMFLRDLRPGSEDGSAAARSAFDHLVDHIDSNPSAEPPSDSVLDWLGAVAGCTLAGEEVDRALEQLRGRHIHLWQEDDAYHILVVSDDPAVVAALEEIARIEAGCQIHPQLEPELLYDDQGTQLVARGPNAFILARLFLALKNEQRP